MSRRPKFDVDKASMEMELAEVAEREEAVRNMAPELALALKAAHRIIMQYTASSVDPEHYIWKGDWPIVEATMDKLLEVEL
jgi:hypothetical protein